MSVTFKNLIQAVFGGEIWVPLPQGSLRRARFLTFQSLLEGESWARDGNGISKQHLPQRAFSENTSSFGLNLRSSVL